MIDIFYTWECDFRKREDGRLRHGWAMLGATLEKEKDTLNEDPHLQKKKKNSSFHSIHPNDHNMDWWGRASSSVYHPQNLCRLLGEASPHLHANFWFHTLPFFFYYFIYYYEIKSGCGPWANERIYDFLHAWLWWLSIWHMLFISVYISWFFVLLGVGGG